MRPSQLMSSIASLVATVVVVCPTVVSSLPASSSSPSLPSQSETPAPYTDGDTTGCGKKYYFNLMPKPRSLTSSGRHRRYLVHLPTNYNPKQQYPVIMGFHGTSSVGFFLEADTRLDGQGGHNNRKKIMVYPDGLQGAWAGANYSAATTNEDLQFVADVLHDVRRDFCVDSARIYATGLSNGGGFVNVLACNDTVGGEFAAFAPVSGSFYSSSDVGSIAAACRPARSPTPMLEFHGGSDKSVHYDGGPGQGGTLLSIPAWLNGWVERNGCDKGSLQREELNGGDVHHLQWTCGGREGVLQHYKTDSQKHDWPSPRPNFSQLAAFDLPTYLDATALIQDFFFQYTRPAE